MYLHTNGISSFIKGPAGSLQTKASPEDSSWGIKAILQK